MTSRMLIGVSATTLMIAGLLAVDGNIPASAADKGVTMKTAQTLQRKAVPQATTPQIQKGQRKPLRLKPVDDCIPGFAGEKDPSDGHKYTCTSWQVTGVFGCNQPFQTVSGSQEVYQGKASYRCAATPVASPPANGVCRPPFFAHKLSQSGTKVTYRCTSSTPACAGSFDYQSNSLGYHSNAARFKYQCLY